MRRENARALDRSELHSYRGDILFMVAQLYLQEQNWAKGAETLEAWFVLTDEPNSGAYYILADFSDLSDLPDADPF